MKNEQVVMVTGRHGRTTASDRETDSPWSFVVAVASFAAQVLIGGYAYTGGIYYTVFIEEFPEVSTVAISWLSNMPFTLWFIASPIGSVLANRYGFRICAVVGGSLASAGLCLAFFTTNFYTLFLCYGVIAGCGHGTLYIGFITSVSRYFNKYRTLFTILTTLGPPVGMSTYSFLVPYLINRFHWKASLLILGGVSTNFVALACALFPLRNTVTNRSVFSRAILKMRDFILFCCQCFFCNLSNSLILLHLPSLILSFGLGATVASLSLTAYGISNAIGKVLCGVYGHFGSADPSTVYTVALVVYAVGIAMVPVVRETIWIMCFVSLLAFAYNVTGGQNLEVILDLVGPEHFSNGVGFSQFCKAAGMLVAGPLAGLLYEESGHYSVSFYASSAFMMAGCLILFPVVIGKLRKRSELTSQTTVNVDVPEKHAMLVSEVVDEDHADKARQEDKNDV